MSKYYFFYLEIALKKSKDTTIYAFENVSHIPTKKLIEIFEINLEKDPFLLEGYFLKKKNFKIHKKYIKKNFGQIDLDIFEYSLHQYVADDFAEIRKLFKEDLME